MQGSYNLLLVFASYCVAVIAAYTAIYFGTRLFDQNSGKRSLWLTVGALCMGSGIWSMHFVGMSAYTMPGHMHMSFSFWLTLLSWIPAVLASGLALYVITLPEVSVRTIAASAVIMGAGIFAMHYGGMYAMQMRPGIQYDTLLVIASGIIAVGASGAAMVICRQVRNLPPQHSHWVKLVAALVMGAAICGMHYTGMAAASYPQGAEAAPENLLRGDWMGIPTAVVSCLFLLLALFVAYRDFRAGELAREAKLNQYREAQQVAFFDRATGLPNRSLLEKRVLEKLIVNSKAAQANAFGLLYFELEGYRALQESQGEEAAHRLLNILAAELQGLLDDADMLARYASDSLMLLANPMNQAALENFLGKLARAVERQSEQQRLPQTIHWRFGYSEFPRSGTASRNLIRAAQKIRWQSENSKAAAE